MLTSSPLRLEVGKFEIMNYKNSFSSKNWKFKLPVIAIAFYTIASLPLFFSISTNFDDTLNTLLAILNIPSYIFFDIFFDLIAYETDFIFYIVSLIFWIGIATFIGWVIDLKKDEKIKAVTIRIFLVPIIPVIARIAYFPIDMLITVRLFGCGCHPGFNANSFNFMFMLPIVGGISVLELIRTARVMNGWAKWFFVVICLVVQAITGFICWHWIGWA